VNFSKALRHDHGCICRDEKMSNKVTKPTYANAGSHAYDKVSPCTGDSARYSVKLPSGARFTMLKPGNAVGCEVKMVAGSRKN
jgi:hypothetical protein